MNLIGNFLMAYVFAHNNAAWSFVPDMKDASAGQTIMMAAVFTWLGFYVPTDLNTVAWGEQVMEVFFDQHILPSRLHTHRCNYPHVDEVIK
ncbi:MAG: hypothetical protein WDO15_24790 [Bacteroidota bacterium]